MHSEEPVTLYIVTEPVDKQRLQPLVRVLVNMMFAFLRPDFLLKVECQAKLSPSLASNAR